jgi:hypothetical protein
MKKVWPPVMSGYGEQAEQLCSDLGEHHDAARRILRHDRAGRRPGHRAPARA